MDLSSFLARSGLASLAGSSDSERAQLAAQAQNLWKMLDHMAESNPEEYKSFISSQKQSVARESRARAEQAGLMMQPRPGFVVATRANGINPKGVTQVFMNMCSHESVPAIQWSDGGPVKDPHDLANLIISMSVGPLRPNTYQDKQCHTCDVVVSPSTIGRCDVDGSFLLFVTEVALHELESVCHISMQRPVTPIDRTHTHYVGKDKQPPPQLTEKGLQHRKNNTQQTQKSGGPAQSDIVLPTKSSAPQPEPDFQLKTRVELSKPLIQELQDDTNTNTNTHVTTTTNNNNNDNNININTTAAHFQQPGARQGTQARHTAAAAATTSTSTSTGTLLPHISTRSEPEPSCCPSIVLPSQASAPCKVLIEAVDVDVPKSTPDYSIRCEAGVLHVTCTLPNVSSVNEVDVDISSRRVVLSSQQYALDVVLPCSIADITAAAKWNTKKHRLTITATIQDDSEPT